MEAQIEIFNLIDDLSPFADLGTGGVTRISDSSISFVRNGFRREIRKEGFRLIETTDTDERVFASIASLLASEDYADLRKWARNQASVLKSQVPENMIETAIAIDGSAPIQAETALHNFFVDARSELSLVLMDGPAGVGKTALLKAFALNRAQTFSQTHQPIVLHIESKGKILQNLDDLIALNLQTLRTSVTFDQIPPLVRRGLVIFAIDGFDELGDPNGYELAWAQLNEFIISVKGDAGVILAGRETFVSKDTMLRALPSVTENNEVVSMEVQPVTPSNARSWLKLKGWTEDSLNLPDIRDILAHDSYALRPFFLLQLGDPDIPQRIETGELDNLLGFLIRELVVREANKFGENVDRVVSVQQRQAFIENLMIETAREMAENQSNSISVANLSWLSEVESEQFPQEVRGILKNRARVIAFLTEGEQRDRLPFFHETFFHYWLARATIKSLHSGELPKFVRRNILSVEFLEILSETVSDISPEVRQSVVKFCERVASEIPDSDRTKRNLLAITLSILPTCDFNDDIRFSDVFLEEAFVAETISNIEISNGFISQLYAVDANIRGLRFSNNSHILTIIASSGTLVSHDIPLPQILVVDGREVSDPEEIESWRFDKGTDRLNFEIYNAEQFISKLPLFGLLQRLARIRRYWIKDDSSDLGARKILEDPAWGALKDVLEAHGLISTEDNVGASGRPAKFYHLKNKTAFLDLSNPPESVIPFLQDLLSKALEKYEDDNFAE